MGREQTIFDRTVAEAIRQARLLFVPRAGNQSSTGNASGTQSGLVPPVPLDATEFLNGAAPPKFAKVKDSDLAVSDVVANDVSIAAHGFAPKGPNDATKYLDGTGAYSVPAGGAGFPGPLPTFPTLVTAGASIQGRFSAEPTISGMTLNTDGLVAQWNDASGNWGSNFTAATNARPRWMKRAMNGMRPGVVFDGAGTKMVAAAAKTLAQPFTVVFVLQNWKGGFSNNNLFRDSNTGAVVFQTSGNSWSAFAGTSLSSAALFSQNTQAVPDSMIAAPAVMLAVFNNTSSIIANNGVEVTGTTGTTGISGTMRLGGDASSSFGHLVLYEALFIAGALNSTDRAALNTYYATALDITL